MVAHKRGQLSLASTFAGAASRYWLGVFPLVVHEVRHWRARARAIPDPGLREIALVTQREEQGNLEGAAAFGVLVPSMHRRAAVRALVAFQVIYDYIDTLAEQPCADPVANGRQLHLALLAALDPWRDHADYYEHSSGRRDDGYMMNLIETCRSAVAALPSHPSVLEPALRSARRMVTYQSLIHNTQPHRRGALARWAGALTPADADLRWWEMAAAGASSLTVFALIAAAAKPGLSAAETAATEEAYFPSIGALHVLLDSLIDRAKDLELGHHNLIDHYSSPAETAHRLASIAGRAVRGAEALPDGARHALIVAAMASFYLTAPSISTPATLSAAEHVRESMGAPARPTLAVFKARRALGRMFGAGDEDRDHGAPEPAPARASTGDVPRFVARRTSAAIRAAAAHDAEANQRLEVYDHT